MTERRPAWRELRSLTDRLNREEDEALEADGSLDAALLRQERRKGHVPIAIHHQVLRLIRNLIIVRIQVAHIA